LLNTTPMEDSIFFHSAELAKPHVIAAYLAGNPRLDAICDEILSRVKAEQNRVPILRLIEYVRRERTKGGGKTS